MPWRLPVPWVSKGQLQREATRAGITIGGKQTDGPTIAVDDGFLPLSFVGTRGGAQSVPAAYAAVNLLTDQLSMLPRRVVDEKGMPVGHWLDALLKFPSRIVDPFQFWQIMHRSYIAHGNSYAWIRRDFVTKRPIELVPAICNRAEFRQSRWAPYVRYSLHLLGSGAGYVFGFAFNRHIEANSSDVIAFHAPGFDGLYSPSPIRYAAQPMLEAMREVTEHHKNMLKEGINSGMALTMEPDATKSYQYALDEFDRINESVKEQYKGARNSGKLPFLPPAVTLTRVQALSALDLQLIELLKWGVEDIARVFGVSPIRLGHYYEGMRVTGFEMQSADFERYSIANHVARTDSQLTRKLLGDSEGVADLMMGRSIAADTDMIKQGTLSERGQIAKDMVTGGIWQINEGRELTGQQPHPDGDRLLDPRGAPAQSRGRDPQDMPPGGNNED